MSILFLVAQVVCIWVFDCVFYESRFFVVLGCLCTIDSIMALAANSVITRVYGKTNIVKRRW